MSLRLAFMGSPDFALPSLRALIAAGHEIACVYSQPPRPAGRGKQDRPTPVHAFAVAAGLPVRTPEALKDREEQAAFAALGLDAAVVVAYGLLLPQPILDAPRLGCLNLHGSLLPRWRGAAPIQRALMAGDAITGVQVMQMEAGLDTGPVLASAETPIAAEDTAGTLHDRLAAMGASLLAETLAKLERGEAKAVPQDEEGVVHAHKLTSADTRIDWTKSATAVDCQIRGLAPAPGAWFMLPTARGPVRTRALFSRVEAGEGAPGAALDDRLLIACGEGAVRLLSVQREGGAALEAGDFLRGAPTPAGTNLG
ncbi:MAG: methionyl-tRNA formyltransferase [Hyphomonadaceae bacterium]|nr:methionyl-tRNA formyltransferase [Hyphomonadaceae bacterium]